EHLDNYPYVVDNHKMIDIQEHSEVSIILQQLGLSHQEVLLYVNLLKNNYSTTSSISKIIKEPRTNTHRYIGKLVKKGLVSRSLRDSQKLLIAENPNKIELLLKNQEIAHEEKLKEIRDTQENVYKVITQLNQYKNSSDEEMIEVKYYEGKLGARSIYIEAFAAEELRSYVNLGAAHKTFPENSQLYIDCQKKKSSSIVKEIIDNSEVSVTKATEYAKSNNFKFKIAPYKMNIDLIDILIYDGKVAMINFRNSIVGSVLINKDYYLNSKVSFDFMWDRI
ncbi:hypothetical protein JW887_01125, partial [Candidatus Dojkabacteria bacterium]|nr:hypothetical protein [Candidatus Dojkabacteria bacterium]